MPESHTTTSSEAGQRLDIFCVACSPSMSRATLQKAIKDGHITVNSQVVKPRYTVKEQDSISFDLPAQKSSDGSTDHEYTDISLPIIYEDKDIVIIDKPAGLLTHPASDPKTPSVSTWFAHRFPESKDVGDIERPGIVHRLDKDTSGLLVLAKTQDSHHHLKEQFHKRKVKKEYQALVFGVPGGGDGRITQPLRRSRRNPARRAIDAEGKPAITEWQRTKSYQGKYALLNVQPYTGRTHQIRVHLHHIGHPIVGDQLYVFKRQKPPAGVKRQLLHANKLTIQLLSGKRRTFLAPLPDDMQDIISLLSGH